jgi:hypothetical protein
MRYCTAIVAAFCIAPLVGNTQEPPKVPLTIIRLKHARPSELKERMLTVPPEWWNPKTAPPYSFTGTELRELPEGIKSVTAFDVDNSLIVRGDKAAVERFRAEIAKFDHPYRIVSIEIASRPILRKQRAHLGQTNFDSFRAVKRSQQNVDDGFTIWTNLGPNGFGELEPDVANPTSGAIAFVTFDTYLTVVPHVEESGTVSLLATVSYRDSTKATRCISRRLLRVSMNSRQHVLYTIDDKQHPVKQYAVDLRVLEVDRPYSRTNDE